jgi:hypothetical protein
MVAMRGLRKTKRHHVAKNRKNCVSLGFAKLTGPEDTAILPL